MGGRGKHILLFPGAETQRRHKQTGKDTQGTCATEGSLLCRLCRRFLSFSSSVSLEVPEETQKDREGHTGKRLLLFLGRETQLSFYCSSQVLFCKSLLLISPQTKSQSLPPQTQRGHRHRDTDETQTQSLLRSQT
jgi:hypothetical protein